MTLRRTLALLILGTALTACGGDDGGAGTAAASIRTFQFSPSTLTVEAGTTVEWTNEDEIEHTVTAKDGGFDEVLDGRGTTASVTFEEPGTYAYLCERHTSMTGEIVVE